MPTISSFSIRAARSVLFVLVMTATGTGLCIAGQSRGVPDASSTGAELFIAGCAGCHGPTGAGMPDSTVGFEKPTTFPDFSQCDQTTPEAEADWWAVIHDGGKARGFSRIMPAFGDLLTARQISALVKHLRSLCHDQSWPIGELNFPRPLNTEKAFPESETVISTTVGARRVHDVTSTLRYERRLGIKDQLEVSIPFRVMHDPSATAIGGIGDIGIGLKHVLFSSTGAGSILSVQGEVIAPTGNRDKGLGAGVPVFEGFAAIGQRLPHQSFVMGQAGTEQPTDTADTPRAAYGRVAIGKMFRADQGLGRLLTPMVELLANRDFETAAATDLDLVPQFQVTLSQRQHVRAGVGVQVPVNHRAGRPVQAAFYLLWDWFDGGLFEGWK